jgi:hypothetical protein
LVRTVPWFMFWKVICPTVAAVLKLPVKTCVSLKTGAKLSNCCALATATSARTAAVVFILVSYI